MLKNSANVKTKIFAENIWSVKLADGCVSKGGIFTQALQFVQMAIFIILLAKLFLITVEC
jgi:hypothetical protein